MLGLNGSGKSTLLRIIAGVDKDYQRRDRSLARLHHRLPRTGAEAGRIEDRPRDRRGGRSGDRRSAEGIRRDQRQIRRADGSDDEMNKLHRTPGRGAGKARRMRTPGTSTAAWRWRWTRCAARRARRRSKSSRAARGAASRCAACCCRSPTSCCSTSRPTISTPRPSAGSNSILQKYEGTVIAVTHDRYFLDNVAGWILELDRGQGIPWKGNYSSWLEQKQERLRAGREDGEQAAEDARTRAGMDPDVAEGAATPSARPASTLTKRCSQPGDREAGRRRSRSTSRPGRRLGDVVIEADECQQRLTATSCLFEDLTFSLPPGGIVGVIGPNGAGKTTLFRMITGQEKADARHVQGRRDGQARLRRSVARFARREQDHLGGDLRRARRRQARQAPDELAGLCRAVQLLGRRSAEEGRAAFRRRTQSRPSGEDAQIGRERACCSTSRPTTWT